MKDLRYIFSYLKPYRRDMTLAVLLIFIECVFEMQIPLLMTDIVDVGVPNHDLRLLLLQGGTMALCALPVVFNRKEALQWKKLQKRQTQSLRYKT